MSDGALSQAEIDALLTGGLMTAGSGDSAAGGVDTKALQTFFGGTVDSLSSNLSMITGGTAAFSAPTVSQTNRDDLLKVLPDTVSAINIDFSSGFPGEHLFLISEDTAKTIAGLMNKEENPDLDGAAMSAIGESISQLTGTLITALTNKTGNKSIASNPPQAANMPKAAAALPSGNFVSVEYKLNIDGAETKFWEILGEDPAKGISKALTAPPPAAGKAAGSGGGAPAGGIPGSTPNMQSIQFPNLKPGGGPQEPGNIGLLMDVYMEMTVELGRTRKSIKEILSMGEGTIIELDKLAGEPVDILVNRKLIAKGEVVVIDENFGVRVTEIVSPADRMPDM